jgi:hypothetical protein
MRNSLLLSIALASVALSSATATGCYSVSGDCGLFNCGSGGTGGAAGGDTGGSGGSGGTTVPDGCVPKDAPGPVADGCGIFVGSIGNDENVGSKGNPVQTLQNAIAKAKEGEKRVYACAETFTESILVDGDVTIFGGLDCTANWAYSSTARTNWTAAPESIPLRIAPGIRLTMEDVDVTAADAAVAGGSSIAIIADNMASLDLTRSAVSSGLAMAGADGDSFPGTASDGAIGSMGVDACLGAQAITPPAPANRCGDIDSAGGSGGISEAIQGSAGNAGLPQITENGGAGEVATACKLGTAGANGMNGQSGDGAIGPGTVDANGYMGVAGDNGSPGTTAQGGGGGGGSKGGSGAGKCADALKAAGASGGSGGSGGCGGQGGNGGRPGGSSIGIVSLGAKLVFSETTITAKSGGAGGTGSDGQLGGAGAPGGNGGVVPPTATLLKAGCKGGLGGNGGTGGKGGGGQGGHSIGIAHTGTPPETTGVILFVASPGSGGAGDGMSDITDGEKGVAADLHAF